ncbi:MAG: hypothetical protein ACE5HP_10930 [Gemmatimonadota bacterium]
MAVQGDFAYLSQGPHLTVLDVAQPSTPVLVARLRLPIESTSAEIVRDIAVSGSLAVVADGFRGVWTVDVSIPTAPELLGSYVLREPSTTRGVAIAGTSAYIAGGRSGVWVLDLSDPSSPALQGTYDTPGYAAGVAVADTLAFVADGPAGMLILDVSDPSAPILSSSLRTPGPARAVAVSGSLVFGAVGSGLAIVEVLDPRAPVVRGLVETPGRSEAVALTGSIALVADGWEGLAIIDASDASAPALLAPYHPPSIGYTPDVAVSGERVHAAHMYTGAPFRPYRVLTILDSSDPSSPALLGSYDVRRSLFGLVWEGLIFIVAPLGLLVAVIAAAIRTRRRILMVPVPAERSHLGIGFWLAWVAATTLGLGAGMALGWALGFGLGGDVAVALGKGLPWPVVGLLQWHVLRREVSVTGWWPGAYVLGGAVFAMFAFAVGWSLGDVPSFAGIIMGPVLGLLAGGVHWLAFRRRLSLSIEWVLVSMIGWALGLTSGFAGAHGVDLVGAQGGAGPAVQALVGSVAGTVGGAITGGMILWLLRHPLSEVGSVFDAAAS